MLKFFLKYIIIKKERGDDKKLKLCYYVKLMFFSPSRTWRSGGSGVGQSSYS
jgi:hypothetical protein